MNLFLIPSFYIYTFDLEKPKPNRDRISHSSFTSSRAWKLRTGLILKKQQKNPSPAPAKQLTVYFRLSDEAAERRHGHYLRHLTAHAGKVTLT